MSKKYRWYLFNEKSDKLLFLSALWLNRNDLEVFNNKIIMRYKEGKIAKDYVVKSINLNNELIFKRILKIAEISRKNACEMNIEGYSKLDLDNNGLEKSIGQISSTLTKLSYLPNEPDILTIASWLLYKTAIGHNYQNGNKRTALFMFMNFLQMCGLWLCSGEHQYTKYWEQLMVSVVQKSQNLNSKDPEEIDKINQDILNLIKRKTKNHIRICFKWRNKDEY